MRLAPVLCLLALASSGLAQTPEQRATVDRLLKNRQQSRILTDDDLTQLKNLGKFTMPLLAERLFDPQVDFLAQFAMLEIDANAAMPYLIRNLPSSNDPNAESATLKTANRMMQEYDWFVRAGKPISHAPPPRYPSNMQPYPYKAEVHEAAVRLLQANSARWVKEEAILSIGLTGSHRDFRPLRNEMRKDPWSESLCRAALARLGEKQALNEIAAGLKQPVAAKLEDGVAVTWEADGQRMRALAFEAGFSMNRRLVPSLLLHRRDLPGQRHGDYSDPSPSSETIIAIGQILFGKQYTLDSDEEWTKAAQAAVGVSRE